MIRAFGRLFGITLCLLSLPWLSSIALCCLVSLPFLLLALNLNDALVGFPPGVRRSVLGGSLLGLAFGTMLEVQFAAQLLLAMAGYVWLWTAIGLVEDFFRARIAYERARVERLGLRELRARGGYRVLDGQPGRRLLEWRMRWDEPVRAVEVICPSTGQDYLLRVPPSMSTCQSAVAWTFGMNASTYAPLVET